MWGLNSCFSAQLSLTYITPKITWQWYGVVSFLSRSLLSFFLCNSIREVTKLHQSHLPLRLYFRRCPSKSWVNSNETFKNAYVFHTTMNINAFLLKQTHAFSCKIHKIFKVFASQNSDFTSKYHYRGLVY